MNLLDLLVRIGVRDEASDQLQSLSATAIAKAQVIANAVTSAIQSAISAISSLIQSAIGAFAQYEQNVGGIETFFGNAAGTVIDNAKNAYQTAGMSANEYMSNVSSFAMSLITSVSKQRAQSLAEDTTAQQNALDAQLANLQQAQAEELSSFQKMLNEEYKARQRELEDEYEEYSNSLSDQLEARREQLSDEYDNLRKSLSKAVEARREADAEALSKRRDALNEEYEALANSLADEVQAYRDATEARIGEINREYTERLKLIDEEEYNRVKAIDEQIAALNGQTEAERAANKQRQQQQREAAMRERLANAVTVEERAKAQQDLDNLLADMEQDRREAERKDQISKLKDDKARIQEEADQRRAVLKTTTEEYLTAYATQRTEELKTMQEHNAKKLEEFQTNANEILKKMSEAQAKEIELLQKANEKELKERSKHNSEILKQMQRDNSKLLKAASRNNADILSDFKDSQEAQVSALKNAQAQQLQALSESVDAQKKKLQEAAEAGDGYVKATEEDQRRAAELADMAMRDISDNANKMGTNIQSLEYAYQGFAKQNFTMLDNLKLGYSGTKEGMQSLLDDAEKVQAGFGELKTYSVDSFADIVEAVHVMQTEMGISGVSVDELRRKIENNDFTLQELSKLREAWGMQGSTLDEVREKAATLKDKHEEFTAIMGTTAKEGSTTIEGAWNKAKAAWENWLISLTDPEWDVEQSTTELVDSVGNAAGLIAPRVGKILGEVYTIAKTKGPEIARTLKDSFLEALPPEFRDDLEEYKVAFDNLTTAVEFLNRVFSVFIWLIKAITLPIQAAMEGLGYLAADIWSTFDDSMLNAAELEAVNKNTADNMLKTWEAYPEDIKKKFINADGTLTEAGQKIIDGLQTGAESEWEQKKPWWESVADWIAAHKGPVEKDAKLLEPAGRSMITGLMNGAKSAWSLQNKFFSGLGNVIAGMFNGAGGWLTGAGSGLMNGLRNGLSAAWPNVTRFVSSLPGNITSFFSGAGGWLTGAGGGLLSGFRSGISGAWGTVSSFIGKIPSAITGFFKNTGKWLVNAGNNIITGFWNGMANAWHSVSDWISGIGRWIAEHKGPKAYDLALLVPAGKWIMKGLKTGLAEEFERSVMPYVESITKRVADAMEAGDYEYDLGIRQAEEAYESAHNAYNMHSAAVAEHGRDSAQAERTLRDLTVIFEMDRMEFGRAVYRVNQEEEQRVGLRLAGGAA